MNMIFEVADLAVASPATVSRCGMVYVQPDLLGWRPVMLSWLAALPAGITEAQKAQMLALADWLVPPCLRAATKLMKAVLPMVDINLVCSLMRLLESHLDEFRWVGQGLVLQLTGSTAERSCYSGARLCVVSKMRAAEDSKLLLCL